MQMSRNEKTGQSGWQALFLGSSCEDRRNGVSPIAAAIGSAEPMKGAGVGAGAAVLGHRAGAGHRAQGASRRRVWTIAAAFLLLAVVGRVAMAGVPNVQPVTALCIVTGIVCGRRQGLAVGAACALASNVFLGQGPWTIFQMLGWGLAGWGAGVLFGCGGLLTHVGRRGSAVCGDTRSERWSGQPLFRTLLIYMYGFVASLAFGLLMDSQIILLFGGAMPMQAIAGIYAAGIPFNLMHAAGTVAFLVPLCALLGHRAR